MVWTVFLPSMDMAGLSKNCDMAGHWLFLHLHVMVEHVLLSLVEALELWSG